MNRLLNYQDTVKLVQTTQNGWGDHTVSVVAEIPALFHEGTSQAQSSYVERIACDAHVYLDPENEYIKGCGFRLEGMYLVANLYGGIENESWYKISRVVVGQRKLLTNEINNVHCYLTKCDALEIES